MEIDRRLRVYQQNTFVPQTPEPKQANGRLASSLGGRGRSGDFAKYFYDLLDESSPNPLVSAAARSEMMRLQQRERHDRAVHRGDDRATAQWSPKQFLE